MNSTWLLTILTGTSLAHAQATPAYPWREVLQAAQSYSESIQESDWRVTQSEERHRQAKGALFPNLSAQGGSTWQDLPSPTTPNNPNPLTFARINLSQPLLRGFAEYAALRQTGVTEEAEKFRRSAARLSIADEVLGRYAAVLRAQVNLDHADQEIKLYDSEIQEVRKRAGIGRARKSDRLSLEAARSEALAAREEAENALTVAWREVIRQTGLPAERRRLEDLPPAPETLEPLGRWIDRLKNHPAIRAAYLQVNAQEESVSIARGGHFPSLDLEGNYYLHRTGLSRNIQWDAALTASLPLFAGGVTSSQVREAGAAVKIQELEAKRISRDLELAVRSAYELADGARTRLPLLQDALKRTEESYRETRQESKLGLVSVFDLIDSARSLERTRKAYDLALIDRDQNTMRLKVLTETEGDRVAP